MSRELLLSKKLWPDNDNQLVNTNSVTSTNEGLLKASSNQRQPIWPNFVFPSLSPRITNPPVVLQNPVVVPSESVQPSFQPRTNPPNVGYYPPFAPPRANPSELQPRTGPLANWSFVPPQANPSVWPPRTNPPNVLFDGYQSLVSPRDNTPIETLKTHASLSLADPFSSTDQTSEYPLLPSLSTIPAPVNPCSEPNSIMQSMTQSFQSMSLVTTTKDQKTQAMSHETIKPKTSNNTQMQNYTVSSEVLDLAPKSKNQIMNFAYAVYGDILKSCEERFLEPNSFYTKSSIRSAVRLLFKRNIDSLKATSDSLCINPPEDFTSFFLRNNPKTKQALLKFFIKVSYCSISVNSGYSSFQPAARIAVNCIYYRCKRNLEKNPDFWKLLDIAAFNIISS